MCGVAVDSAGTTVTVHPGEIEPFGFRVPGDISSAAFFLALVASRPGWRSAVPALASTPAGSGILEVLEMMGAEMTVSERETAGGVGAGRRRRGHGVQRLHGVTIAGCADGAMHRRIAGDRRAREPGRWRHRDPRRRGVAHQGGRPHRLLEAGLRLLGVSCESTADTLVIHGSSAAAPPRASMPAGDHRLAMAWAIAASLVPVGGGESVIDGADVAAVSYPGVLHGPRASRLRLSASGPSSGVESEHARVRRRGPRRP